VLINYLANNDIGTESSDSKAMQEWGLVLRASRRDAKTQREMQLYVWQAQRLCDGRVGVLLAEMREHPG
jgi:hypothetical protein